MRLRAVPPHLPVLAFALALSSVGLLGGPLILSLGRGRALTAAMVEGLTLGLVPIMVLLRLLPHVAEELGIWAFALTALAFFALRWFDRAHHRAAARVGRAFIYTALLFHSFTDGVGLAAAIAASSQTSTIDHTLMLAFVVHRLPEGLFIATTLVPSYGTRRTLVRIGGLIGATLLGGALSGLLLPYLPERALDAVVALGLGAMLQLVVHSHAERPASGAARALASLALVGGVTVALAVPAPHDLLRVAPGPELPMLASLGPFFLRTAPAFVIALLLEALVGLRPVPPPVGKLGGGAGTLARALAFGATVPVGPAGIAPAIRGLAHLGASRAAITVAALAAGTMRLDALFVSFALLGVPLGLVRLFSAAVLLLIAAAATRRRASLATIMPEHLEVPRGRPSLAAFAENLARATDQRGAWLVLALLGAAALEASLTADVAASAPWAVLGLTLVIAIALQLPLLALVPIVQVLAHKGLPPGHALALLVVAPAASRALLAALLESAGVAVVLPLVAATGVCFVGLTALRGPLAALQAPPLHALLGRAPTLLEWVATALLLLGILVGLERLGPRLWLGQLGLFGSEPQEAEPHDHHSH